MKMADNIAFLGRDIEDAIALQILPVDKFRSRSGELASLIGYTIGARPEEINNTALIHTFIVDLIRSSTPGRGIQLSSNRLKLMKDLKDMSNDLIYNHRRLKYFKKLASVILKSIFDVLSLCYHGNDTLRSIESNLKPYPVLRESFSDWIIKYTDIDRDNRAIRGYSNKTVYDMNCKEDYLRAVVHFISGMTDSFAQRMFGELTKFA